MTQYIPSSPLSRKDTAEKVQALNMRRVFDWNEAARLIKTHYADEAVAALSEDWGWTAGTIFKNGKPVIDHYVYLASDWATPIIEINGVEYDCWKYEHESPGWGEKTSWPEESIAILNSPDS